MMIQQINCEQYNSNIHLNGGGQCTRRHSRHDGHNSGPEPPANINIDGIIPVLEQCTALHRRRFDFCQRSYIIIHS